MNATMERTSCLPRCTFDRTLYEDTISRLQRCLLLANRQHFSSVNEEPSHLEGKPNDEVKTIDKCLVAEKSSNTDSLLQNGGLSVESAAIERRRRIEIVDYENELQMADIMRLITNDLSEPYSIYTYRYFIHNWPKLCLLALDTGNDEYVGAIVCKLDVSRQNRRRGYIAMLAVDESCRRLGIGTRLVQQAIANMQIMGCDEVVLETEVTNINAIRLYTNLGFIREKRLFRYYLNGVDAFRLKLFFTSPPQTFDDAHMYARAEGIAG
uniref:N-terminal methionine N(alpha)-acetyltransferase NatC n=1 Tax=Ascaris suum TaxID=6253 RepID=F1LC39_ASCSU